MQDLHWQPIPSWHRAYLVGFENMPGLIRFRLDEHILYIGMEARSLKNFRRFVTPGGTGRKSYTGRTLWGMRRDITLEYAAVPAPKWRLMRLRDALIRKHRPPLFFGTVLEK
jgi:hypothetical protein